MTTKETKKTKSTQANKASKTNKKAVKQPTLLEAIEKIVTVTDDSELKDSELRKCKAEIEFVANSFGITERQAALFCISLEKGPYRVTFSDIAHHLGVSGVRALSYATDIDALTHCRLLRYRDANDEECFDVPAPVVKALKHNEAYHMPSLKGLDCTGMFEVLDQWFDDLVNDAISPNTLVEEIMALLNDNKQLKFATETLAQELDDEDLMLLVYMCSQCVNADDNAVSFGQIYDLYSSRRSFLNAKQELKGGSHELQGKELVEWVCEDGIANTDRYQLTDKAKRKLLSEVKINTTTSRLANMVKPDKITAKKLFYPACMEKQIDELGSFFDEKKFAEIQKRMKDKGFRNGFACLFYGGPGTGKTETVYQLARATGRSIMMVDVPQLRSKWVGDSEKNIKAMFERYREQVKNEKLAPILLFNEADAIITTRRNGAESAVDKMENTIQNIILQEMETLEGIMIATTNLATNMDKAFERRFLYKVKFEKPDATVRSRIWKQMIPDLTDKQAESLGSGYDFSGGQIENVARKNSINSILHGDDGDPLATLMDYCKEETLQATETHRRMGF